MAPTKKTCSNLNPVKSYTKLVTNFCKRHLTWNELLSLLTDPYKLPVTVTLYIIMEIVVNILIIQKVPYTEIDWKAYMQEVEGFLNGTLDYSKLRGDTGPLVYPAGFVYLYSILYYLTSRGTNIRLAQYIFASLHILLLILVFRIYSRTKKVPPYALIIICCTSYRIHSIFVLRLFNDPLAMVLLYSSLNLLMDERWFLGSIFFSLAVSVKMNILLFAPALLAAYCCCLDLWRTAQQLLLCACVQLLLGLPFLLSNPLSYIKGSFDLGRVFEFKWTVNWRFLPEWLFVNPLFHLLLLSLHVAFLLYFSRSWIICFKSWRRLKTLEVDLKPQLKTHQKNVDMSSMAQLFVLPMFLANFLGVVFSRSLHYQFYVWYYHTLPYLAWCTDYKIPTKFVLLGIIEMCWNTYPSTVSSSLSLHACHAALLVGLIRHIRNTTAGVKSN